jgi:hypothetical protein
MGALALTATGLRPGQPSVDALSPSGQARTALRTLERADLGSGTLTPIEALVPEDRLAEAGARLRRVDGVRAVLAPDDARWRRDDTAAWRCCAAGMPHRTVAGRRSTPCARCTAAACASAARLRRTAT